MVVGVGGVSAPSAGGTSILGHAHFRPCVGLLCEVMGGARSVGCARVVLGRGGGGGVMMGEQDGVEGGQVCLDGGQEGEITSAAEGGEMTRHMMIVNKQIG